MDFEKYWNKALKKTEIIRTRIQSLNTAADTHVPYILLSESSINQGDTVVRKGEVLVRKPSLFVPPNNPQFNGFEFDNQESLFSENSLINFLIVRGVTMPSLMYDNTTQSLDVFEDKLSATVKHYKEDLQRYENVTTGLLTAPEDCWQFSLLIFICSQVARNANADIKKVLEDYEKKQN